MNVKTRIGALVSASGLLSSATNVVVASPTPESSVQSFDSTSRAIYVGAAGEHIEVEAPPTPNALGSDTVRQRVWVNNKFDPCGNGNPLGDDDVLGTPDDELITTTWFHSSGGPGATDSNRATMFRGDVPADTRIDTVGLWITHDYADSNGNPNAVDGFDMYFTIVDGFNGTVPMNVEPASSFTLVFPDFPDANTSSGVGVQTSFYLVFDIQNWGLGDQTFELGDTDGIGPDSGNFVPMSFYDDPGDIDHPFGGVGLHDFGYSLAFTHPANAGAGSVFYVGAAGDIELRFDLGTITDNGFAEGFDPTRFDFPNGFDESTGMPLDLLAGNAAGVNEVFAGGLPCGTDGNVEPTAMWLELYEDLEPVECLVDTNNDGDVNVLDIIQFLDNWRAGLDYNSDAQVNILDVIMFITDWQQGC